MKLESLMLVCLIAVVAQALPGTYLIETADEKGKKGGSPRFKSLIKKSLFILIVYSWPLADEVM